MTARHERAAPADLDAEECVLGAMLLSAKAIEDALGVLGPAGAEAFYKPAHGHIFAMIVALYTAGQPVDVVVVADALRRGALIEAIGGIGALFELCNATPAVSLAKRYAGIVAHMASLRTLIGVGAELVELGYHPPPDGPTSGVEAAMSRLAHLGNGHASAELTLAPISWVDFWALDGPEVDWCCEPMLPSGRQVAIYSVAKTGKSLLAVEVAAGMASGRAVLGRASGNPVDVVYVDYEMTPEDLRERLEALGYGPESDLSRLHYYQLAALAPLDTEAGGIMVEAIAKRHGAVAVVIDTVARAVEGDENDAGTFRDFYRHTGRRLKAAGVAVLRLDHAGKDATRGQRGSSGKDDDLDVVFRLEAVDALTYRLTRTRTRVPWVPAQVSFRRVEEPVLAHVLDFDAWPAGTAETAGLLDEAGVALDATVRTAQAALKRLGHGKRQLVVRAALRWRRDNTK